MVELAVLLQLLDQLVVELELGFELVAVVQVAQDQLEPKQVVQQLVELELYFVQAAPKVVEQQARGTAVQVVQFVQELEIAAVQVLELVAVQVVPKVALVVQVVEQALGTAVAQKLDSVLAECSMELYQHLDP